MKILCFYCEDSKKSEPASLHLGVKLPDGVFDLTAAGYQGDLAWTIENWPASQQQIADAMASKQLSLLDENTLKYAPPAPVGAKIICVGQNYRGHIKEMAKGGPVPVIKEPVLFAKFSDTLSAHEASVTLPQGETIQYDYETELVAIVGRGGMNIPKDQALSHLFGYTCGNDLTERDAQMRSTQWLIGKTLPGFAALGPSITTTDEMDAADISIKGYRNGVLVQDTSSSDLLFDIPSLVSYASRFIQLNPGDLIYTGTPSGVIASKDPESRCWLTPGETFDVTIEGIGTLRTYFI